MDTSTTTNFKRERDALATVRDELKLKAHLARKELRDELDQLEKKWLMIEEELQRTKTHARGDVEALGKSARELLLDLKQGYESVKRRLT